MKKILASLLAAFALVTGAQAAGGALVLDKFPKERVSDLAALQNGAKLFVNYCLNCHSAAFMRFNRLTDIGLTEQQIKDNLLFPTDKVGEVMKVSLDAKDAKAWFGALPPDLTLVARSRCQWLRLGADYLYTYLRTFYRDDTRPTGWNNLTSPTWACRTLCGNCKVSAPPSSSMWSTRMIQPRRRMNLKASSS